MGQKTEGGCFPFFLFVSRDGSLFSAAQRSRCVFSVDRNNCGVSGIMTKPRAVPEYLHGYAA